MNIKFHQTLAAAATLTVMLGGGVEAMNPGEEKIITVHATGDLTIKGMNSFRGETLPRIEAFVGRSRRVIEGTPYDPNTKTWKLTIPGDLGRFALRLFVAIPGSTIPEQLVYCPKIPPSPFDSSTLPRDVSVNITSTIDLNRNVAKWHCNVVED